MIHAKKRGLGWVVFLILIAAISAYSAPGNGKLSGVVVDASGTPQMGASVVVLAENLPGTSAAQLLTNQRGTFSADALLPGSYAIRVTLAGFLPAMERHVRVSPNLTTLLRIELNSVFASLDRLRRSPEKPADADEWKWVLRSSAATRPILQWVDGEVLTDGEASVAERSSQRRPRGMIELTTGAYRQGSVANLADSPATAFAYDQKVGHAGRLLLAGHASYERTAAATTAGLATLWLPSGEVGNGPETSLVMRQAKLGTGGPTFRAARLQHSDVLPLGDRLLLRYGGEYVLVGFGSATSSLRPNASLEVRVAPDWNASLSVASQPRSNDALSSSVLQASLAELDALPLVLWRDGRPVLGSGWHEELAIERKMGPRRGLQAAAFRETTGHSAVFGRGTTLPSDFLQDPFSGSFSYDGGGSSSWGCRLAYHQKLTDDWEIAATYAWAGALALEDLNPALDLRNALQMEYRHSLAGRISGRVPKTGTRIIGTYKWISAPVVTRQDRFGESSFGIQPNLNVSLRQPLPTFVMNGRWEALADFRNLLAQGYIPVSMRDGRFILMPSTRSFRGGVSFLF